MGGILCEVVSAVSTVEKEELLLNFVKDELEFMIDECGLDVDGDGRIAKEEFETLVYKPKAARALRVVGVDIVALVDLQDFLFADNNYMSFSEFMDLVLQLRGSNNATVKDLVDFRKRVSLDMMKLDNKMDGIVQALKTRTVRCIELS